MNNNWGKNKNKNKKNKRKNYNYNNNYNNNNRIHWLEQSLNNSNFINQNNLIYQVELNKFILSSINRLNYISDNKGYNKGYNNQSYNNQRYNNQTHNNKKHNNKKHNNQKTSMTTYGEIKKIFLEKDIVNGSMSNIGKGSIPFNMINFLYKNNLNKEKKVINNKVVIDYTSDDEFEEINMTVNNLEDLINLCKYSSTIIGKDEMPRLINIGDTSVCSNKQEVKNIIKKNEDLQFLNSFNDISVINKNEINDIIKKKTDNKKEDKEIISHYDFNGKKYNINLGILKKLLKPLNKLNNLIGLNDLKNSIVEQIIYYIQNFEINNDNMLHTVIEGPPGVGKTEVGKILAEIFSEMEIIPTSKFKIVKRTDLIGEYLGHTAHKTQKVIDEANGGVLFIDEAYSLGSFDKKDSYAKECIDTLNQNLSENKNKIICIIAGYPEQLEKCFFSYNPGLARRFPFRHKIDSYTFSELKDIFINMVEKISWYIDIKDNGLLIFFKKNYKEFPNFAGDIENLVMNCKYSHSKRILLLHPKNRKKINLDDIKNGFKRYCFFKKNKDEDNFISLYN